MNVADRIALKFRFNVWAKLKTNIYPSYNLSHSQFGEDMVLRSLIDDVEINGFYVDIGAHHPVLLSNTYHFYCKGWRGINIDATPGSMKAFRILRPEDINLELCLSTNKDSQVTFYMFQNAPLNTFDAEMAEQAIAKGAKLIDTKVMKTTTLTECLDLHLPKGTEIDLMSIDIEGGDELIMMSNDWNRYQPKIIVFEKHAATIQEVEQSCIMQHLSEYDYKIVAKCGPSFILKR
jgi:hypothetical protein